MESEEELCEMQCGVEVGLQAWEDEGELREMQWVRPCFGEGQEQLYHLYTQ